MRSFFGKISGKTTPNSNHTETEMTSTLRKNLAHEQSQILQHVLCRQVAQLSNSPSGITPTMLQIIMSYKHVSEPQNASGSNLLALVSDANSGSAQDLKRGSCDFEKLLMLDADREMCLTLLNNEILSDKSPPLIPDNKNNTQQARPHEELINDLIMAIIACDAEQSFKLMLKRQLELGSKQYKERVFQELVEILLTGSHPTLFAILLQQGMNPDTQVLSPVAPDKNKTLPLPSAIMFDFHDFIIKIENTMVDPTHHDHIKVKYLEEMTRAFQAKANYTRNVLRLLVEAGADFNAGPHPANKLAEDCANRLSNLKGIDPQFTKNMIEYLNSTAANKNRALKKSR